LGVTVIGEHLPVKTRPQSLSCQPRVKYGGCGSVNAQGSGLLGAHKP
jgi:hypothetical protein